MSVGEAFFLATRMCELRVTWLDLTTSRIFSISGQAHQQEFNLKLEWQVEAANYVPSCQSRSCWFFS
jgi:hypothetical protein